MVKTNTLEERHTDHTIFFLCCFFFLSFVDNNDDDNDDDDKGIESLYEKRHHATPLNLANGRLR